MANEPQSEAREMDRSHELDMVVLFSSSNHDAELEATAIHSILEANGIPSFVVGPSVIPSLEFQVQVPREDLERAREVVAEAQDAGPDAAAEAEAASEENP
jgi:butyrate kinase